MRRSMLQLSEGIRLMAQDVSADYLTDALIAAVHHSKIELHFQKGLAGGADTAIAAESQRDQLQLPLRLQMPSEGC